MKNTLLRTVVIFVALCIYPSIHAYDFEYDGFYYDITSDSTGSAVSYTHLDVYKRQGINDSTLVFLRYVLVYFRPSAVVPR